MSRPSPGTRADYRFFHEISTRWGDNDVYGHVNNVIYYSWFDTAVNALLIENDLLDLGASREIGIVAENGCRYHASVTFPERITVGGRVARLGTSAVRYELGIFRHHEAGAAAEGYFVHVYVDRASMRPVPLPERLRAALSPFLISPRTKESA